MFFNKNLKFLVATKGFSQTKIAEDLNIGLTTFRKYFDDSQPRLEKLLEIEKYFGVTLDQLLKTDIEKDGLIATVTLNLENAVNIISDPTEKHRIDELIKKMVDAKFEAYIEPLKTDINAMNLLFEINKKLDKL